MHIPSYENKCIYSEMNFPSVNNSLGGIYIYIYRYINIQTYCLSDVYFIYNNCLNKFSLLVCSSSPISIFDYVKNIAFSSVKICLRLSKTTKNAKVISRLPNRLSYPSIVLLLCNYPSNGIV